MDKIKKQPYILRQPAGVDLQSIGGGRRAAAFNRRLADFFNVDTAFGDDLCRKVVRIVG